MLLTLFLFLVFGAGAYFVLRKRYGIGSAKTKFLKQRAQEYDTFVSNLHNTHGNPPLRQLVEANHAKIIYYFVATLMWQAFKPNYPFGIKHHLILHKLMREYPTRSRPYQVKDHGEFGTVFTALQSYRAERSQAWLEYFVSLAGQFDLYSPVHKQIFCYFVVTFCSSFFHSSEFKDASLEERVQAAAFINNFLSQILTYESNTELLESDKKQRAYIFLKKGDKTQAIPYLSLDETFALVTNYVQADYSAQATESHRYFFLQENWDNITLFQLEHYQQLHQPETWGWFAAAVLEYEGKEGAAHVDKRLVIRKPRKLDPLGLRSDAQTALEQLRQLEAEKAQSAEERARRQAARQAEKPSDPFRFGENELSSDSEKLKKLFDQFQKLKDTAASAVSSSTGGKTTASSAASANAASAASATSTMASQSAQAAKPAQASPYTSNSFASASQKQAPAQPTQPAKIANDYFVKHPDEFYGTKLSPEKIKYLSTIRIHKPEESLKTFAKAEQYLPLALDLAFDLGRKDSVSAFIQQLTKLRLISGGFEVAPEHPMIPSNVEASVKLAKEYLALGADKQTLEKAVVYLKTLYAVDGLQPPAVNLDHLDTEEGYCILAVSVNGHFIYRNSKHSKKFDVADERGREFFEGRILIYQNNATDKHSEWNVKVWYGFTRSFIDPDALNADCRFGGDSGISYQHAKTQYRALTASIPMILAPSINYHSPYEYSFHGYRMHGEFYIRNSGWSKYLTTNPKISGRFEW